MTGERLLPRPEPGGRDPVVALALGEEHRDAVKGDLSGGFSQFVGSSGAAAVAG